MVELAIYCFVITWLSWIGLSTFVFLLGAWLSKPKHPEFNGFRVFIPDDWVRALEMDELRMVIMHEHGHRAHLHVWKNLLRLFFFMPMTAKRRVRQELEADDYVTDSLALASALRKMSNEGFDLIRAMRLEAKVGVVPYERDARATPPIGSSNEG